MTQTAFDRFEIGDHVVFDRTFSLSDFEAFSKLSEDRNPFHSDVDYASIQGGREQPIVPLHLTLAPLSMIAGMDLPGEPSLYLGHEIRASSPVYYDEKITYSARVTAINRSYRILTLRVLAFCGVNVVLDAVMRVQARYADWQPNPLHSIRSISCRTALVTGASGEIGQAIAVALARNGWDLLLVDRAESSRRDRLRSALQSLGATFRFFSANLGDQNDCQELARSVRDEKSLALVVHAASPQVSAPIGDHVDLAFSALKRLIDASLPSMLARQDGAFVFLGTSATESALPGWEAYAAAKMMATQLMRTVNLSYSDYGILAHTLAPGLVATDFSAAFRKEGDAVLMPSEVAEHLIALIQSSTSTARDLILTSQAATRGQYGFTPANIDRPSPAARDSVFDREALSAQLTDGASTIVPTTARRVLKLPSEYSLDGSSIGTTPGWDSLRHIELLLAIEEAADIHFSSDEIATTHSYDGLVSLVSRKKRGPSRD